MVRLPVWGSWVGSKAGSEAVVLKDDFDEEPVENGYGTFGNFQLVGHGRITNGKCGTFSSYYGCAREELHRLITLDGVNYSGKVYKYIVFHSCDKPSCSICFKRGWAVREAGRIEARLIEASKRFGKVEHVVCSVPVKDYGLSYEALRKKIDKVCYDLGVAGVKIFHGFRYNKRKDWYWSPHFHVLGFVLGGFRRCRRCKGGDCYTCDGFKGKSTRSYRNTGYIVKVLDERKTIGGTAWYILNHATIDVTKKRFQVATWFGFCSYRKMKVTAEYRKKVCPICQHDCGALDYFGIKRFVLDRDMPDYKRESFEDLMENGRVVWREREPKEYR